MHIKALSILILTLLFLLNANPGSANDLSDGISIGDGISCKSTVKKRSKNLKFIPAKAKSNARTLSGAAVNFGSGGGDTVQGGVILKAGASAKNIVVIYNGKNNTVLNSGK